MVFLSLFHVENLDFILHKNQNGSKSKEIFSYTPLLKQSGVQRPILSPSYPSSIYSQIRNGVNTLFLIWGIMGSGYKSQKFAIYCHPSTRISIELWFLTKSRLANTPAGEFALPRRTTPYKKESLLPGAYISHKAITLLKHLFLKHI